MFSLYCDYVTIQGCFISCCQHIVVTVKIKFLNDFHIRVQILLDNISIIANEGLYTRVLRGFECMAMINQLTIVLIVSQRGLQLTKFPWYSY